VVILAILSGHYLSLAMMTRNSHFLDFLGKAGHCYTVLFKLQGSWVKHSQEKKEKKIQQSPSTIHEIKGNNHPSLFLDGEGKGEGNFHSTLTFSPKKFLYVQH
jgi:hypothetical protein